MRKNRVLLLMLVLSIIFSVFTSLTPPDVLVQADTRGDEYVFRRSWGGEGDQLVEPQDVAVGPDGRIYVLSDDYVVIIRPGERIFTRFGGTGSITGLFSSPSGIAVCNNGHIYIVDTSNHRIQKFSSIGDFITQWGSQGSDTGQFYYPSGIDIDSNGDVFVVDSGNHRIQKFSANGIYLTQWGTLGGADGQFQSPNDIAVNDDGYLFVTDTFNNRIQKFTSTGVFTKKWGIWGGGSNTGQFSKPRGIAVGFNGNIFIADTGNHRLQKLTSDGDFITQWASMGTGIDADNSGNIYVAERFSNRIQKYTSNGSILGKWGVSDISPVQFENVQGICMDGNGNIYIADHFNRFIYKFSINFIFITKWGGHGSEVGQFNQPSGVAVDEFGNVFVADTLNHRIQKFTSNGSYITHWGSYGSATGQLDWPRGIAVDFSGNVYVADSNNNRIQKFSTNGVFLAAWGSNGSEQGQFHDPLDVAVDGEGNVYVVDTINHRIQKFTSNGVFLDKWGTKGTEVGQFDRPSGIVVDILGNVFIADRNNHRIQKFTSDGSFVTQWGSRGSNEGQFSWYDPISAQVVALSIDSNGNAYVADRRNDRIKVFSPGLPNPDPYSGLALNGSYEASPALSEWTYGGELPVSRATHAAHGSYSLQLGQPVSQATQGLGDAYAHTTFYVRPEWDKPTLSFKYNLFVNDITHYSDFFVAIQDGVGLNHLETVLRDGYPGDVAPPAGHNMGWRTATFDLSAYKGQHIRLVFSNRNLWPNSWGIWSFVDDVRVLDIPEGTFVDVPEDHWAADWIRRLSNAGITTGCGTDLYCPENPVTRAEMAVFLERGMHGRHYTPPTASGSLFADVTHTHWAAGWIEQLYADGITTGCGVSPLRYCPENPVNRAEMAAFLLRAKYGQTYTPPPATGIFSDVGVSHWAAGWIEKLYADGITSGCGVSPLRYCPGSAVTRAEMAAFLVRAFSLP